MKRFRAKLIIRAKACGPDFHQLTDDALKALDLYKETEYETVEADSLSQAGHILIDRHLPSLRIAKPDIKVIFDTSFKS